MKAGFWVAPEGEDDAIAILPIGGGDTDKLTRKPSILASASAETMIARAARAAALLPDLVDALKARAEGRVSPPFDITDFPEDDLTLINDVLGEGEVSGIASLPDGIIAQIQESVMTGIWRLRFTDADGRLVADYIEIADIPAVVRQAAETNAPVILHGNPPDGAMNVMPILTEIKNRMGRVRPGVEPLVINFSLLPMSPADMDFLQSVLGSGPVRLTSRGYGSCRILATGARHVWSVQYFNAMDQIVLDTLEVGGVPAVACAAAEDFADSAERLAEIEEAYFK